MFGINKLSEETDFNYSTYYYTGKSSLNFLFVLKAH